MEDVKTRLPKIASSSMLALAFSLGHNLKIFDAMAAVSSEENPASPAQIADKAGLKPRYVREWLCVVACGGIVEVDEAGEHFWIKKENVSLLSGPNLSPLVPAFNMFPYFACLMDKIENVFQKDGPLGMDWNDYKGLHKYMAVNTENKYKDHLIPDFIPLTGMMEKLEQGHLQVLDVGCGGGFQLSLFAKHFTTSYFTGVDVSKEAVKSAKQRAAENNIKNVEFLEMNANELKVEWTGRFDWALTFNSLHGQMRPDLCLKEIQRVLKDDGVLTAVDINGTSNAYLDKQADPLRATFSYGASMFACLPCSSNSPDSLKLGSMWGQKRALQLFNECGFCVVKVTPLDFLEECVLYVCKKC